MTFNTVGEYVGNSPYKPNCIFKVGRHNEKFTEVCNRPKTHDIITVWAILVGLNHGYEN